MHSCLVYGQEKSQNCSFMGRVSALIFRDLVNELLYYYIGVKLRFMSSAAPNHFEGRVCFSTLTGLTRHFGFIFCVTRFSREKTVYIRVQVQFAKVCVE